MDAKRYIESFRDKGLVGQSDTVPGDDGLLHRTPSRAMTEMLVCLYQQQSLGDVAQGKFDGELPLTVHDLRFARIEGVVDASRLSTNGSTRGRLQFTKYSDETGSFSVDELTARINSVRSHLQEDVVLHSARAYCRTVEQMQTRRTGEPSVIAKTIRETLINSTPELIRILHPWRNTIQVKREFELNSHSVPLEEVAIYFTVVPHIHGVMEWLRNAEEWNDPMHRLCSAYTELETFIALREWVIARNMPYFPVWAPNEFEGGELVDIEATGNKRADILLCCLDPSRNEIIPVQVKNLVTEEGREEYPEVVLVAPRHLGVVTTDTGPVKAGDLVKTGLHVVAQYGRLVNQYVSLHDRKGKASKRELEAYQATLQPAFNHFDYEVVKQIEAYNQLIA